MKRTATATLLLMSLAISNTEAAPDYDPFGVHNDVSIATVLNGGWRILYKGRFSEVLPSVADVLGRACGKIMLASKHLGSDRFDVLAAIDAELYQTLNTARNETLPANGARWYKNAYSMGFAGADDTINQTSADTRSLSERDRLSWHTVFLEREARLQMNGGWRSGDHHELNRSDEWERFILTSTPSPDRSSATANPNCLPVG